MTSSELKEIKEGKKHNEEDIDLGVLFNLLNRLINNLARWITIIFNLVFNTLIRFLIYIKHHLLKFVIAAVIGAIAGGIYQYQFKVPVYTSSMTVQANYESIIQLYKDLEYCNGLMIEKDYDGLSAFFNINTEDAKSITKIEVSPYTNNNQIILAYNDFVTKLDTSAMKNADFKEFSQNIPKEEFLYHVIEINSTNKKLFSKFEAPILNSLAKNPYYSKLKSTEISNLQSQEKVLKLTMQELDSLREFYKELSLNESKKENGASTFYLGDKENDNREILVFDKYIKANIDLIDVRSEMNKKQEIINVVSSFDLSGSRIKGWLNNTMIQGFIGGILLIFIYLFLIESNKFITDQERKLKK